MSRLLTFASAPLAALALALPANCTPAPANSSPAAEESGAQDPPIPADTEIVSLPSGLKYSILASGEGTERPTAYATVKVHYTGWLENGTVFDSSRKRGQPTEFPLNRVIKGWTEGLQLMSAGDRYKFTIPYDLAYGENGSPPSIPAKATLIFDVELLEIVQQVVVPEFEKLSETEAKTTESGLKYVVKEPGEGASCTASDHIELAYTFWTEDGDLRECSALNGRPIRANVGDLTLPFFTEAVQLMRPGARFHFEVPPALAWGDEGGPVPPGSVTIWELEIKQVFTVPEFTMPAEDKLVTTESGLKYEVIQAGTGAKPTMGQNVTVNYAGWLTDGTHFDSSFSRGEPASFMLGRVIAGWNEGLQLMQEGATYKFVIPANLAYGESGSPPKIGPNAMLVFFVELIKVGN